MSFITLISVFANAQKGSLSGKIISKNNHPISYANIQLNNTNYKTITDGKGQFSIENIKLGEYILSVKFLGYKEYTIKVVINPNETTVLPTIVLIENQEELKEVVLEGHKRNKYTIEAPSNSLRINTPIQKLAQNVQVLSSELLADQQTTNIMDGVTRNVSGVTMIEHWGNFARINMRGFRLPAFRNGFNFQDSWGPLSEDMNTVERIEFVKGPAGFMMSAGEPGGFYNVVTKKPTANKVANISVSAGSFEYLRTTIDLGGKLTEDGKLLYRFNGMFQTTDTHRGNENTQRYGIAPALTYNFSDKTSITTELNLQDAQSYLGSAYIFAPVGDGYGSLDRDFKFTDNNYPVTNIQELTVFTNLKHQISKNWSFETKLAYLKYDQVGNSAWASINDTGDASRSINIWDALSVGKYFQTYLSGQFHTGKIVHKVLGGFDFTDKNYWADFNQSVSIDQNQPFNIYNPVYGNTDAPVFDRSVALKYRNGGKPYNGYLVRSYYIQDELGFFNDKARLTLAGRYTELVTNGKNDIDNKFTPRIGLSVDILPTFTAYAMYDQAFTAQNGITVNGDPLTPVDGVDIEGGVKKTFFGGKLKTSLGVYQITKQNVANTDYDNPLTGNGPDGIPGTADDTESFPYSVQLGEIQSRGLEFDMQGQITPELNVILNYANTNVEITEDTDATKVGQRIAGHAKHVTNAWVNYNFSKNSKLNGFGASLGYQYQIDRSSWAWGANNQTDLPDYFRLDGAISWKNDKIKVQANINNLLNEYLYSGSNYGTYLYWQSEPGINGRITVSYTF